MSIWFNYNWPLYTRWIVLNILTYDFQNVFVTPRISLHYTSSLWSCRLSISSLKNATSHTIHIWNIQIFIISAEVVKIFYLQIWLRPFMFRHITLKQLNCLTNSCLDGREVTQKSVMPDVNIVRLPALTRILYLIFCIVILMVFKICPKPVTFMNICHSFCDAIV